MIKLERFIAKTHNIMAHKKFRYAFIGTNVVTLVIVFVYAILLTQFGPTGTGQNHQASAATGLKPVMQGLIDRGFFPGTTGSPPTAYAGIVPNIVVNVTWADLQTSAGGGITGGNKLDNALSSLKAGQKIKLRIAAGAYAPNWVKNIGGAPVAYKDSFDGSDQTVPRFWTSGVRDAYNDFMNKMAAKYDSNDNLLLVTISRCSTAFPEVFLRGGSGITADIKSFDANSLVNAGYTKDLDNTCEHEEIDAHKVWTRTRSSIALNPYDNLDVATKSFKGTDVSYTGEIMDYCHTTLGARCVLENDSIREGYVGGISGTLSSSTAPPTSNPYAFLYWKMNRIGPPLQLQTAATPERLGSLTATLDGSIKIGANAVELIRNYDSLISVADLTPYSTRLLANPTGDSGSPPPPPTPSPDTIQPTVTIGGITNGATVSGNVNLTATASDNVGVTKVSFWVDTTLIGTDTTSPYSANWDTTKVADGTHNVTAKAFDAAGNSSAPSYVTVTVKNIVVPPSTTPPTVTGTTTPPPSPDPTTQTVVVGSVSEAVGALTKLPESAGATVLVMTSSGQEVKVVKVANSKTIVTIPAAVPKAAEQSVAAVQSVTSVPEAIKAAQITTKSVISHPAVALAIARFTTPGKIASGYYVVANSISLGGVAVVSILRQRGMLTFLGGLIGR